MKTKPLIAAIIGPTSSGKSRIAIAIAKKIDAEIISMDSTMVYKKMNVGSATPTLQDMQGVKHHLINIMEPWNNYSVDMFLKNTKKILYNINNRNKKFLLVGGTMMYLKYLMEGISSLPKNMSLRKELKKYPAHVLYNILKKNDPIYAKKISYHDTYRIQRAIEIMIICKEPYSVVIQNNKKTGGIGTNLKVYAIIPQKRALLYNSIEKRFCDMLENGLVKEVSNLTRHPKINGNLNSMKSIGYSQAYDYIIGKDNYKSFISKSIIATKQLAKRQITWIKNWGTDINIINTNNTRKLLKCFI